MAPGILALVSCTEFDKCSLLCIVAIRSKWFHIFAKIGRETGRSSRVCQFRRRSVSRRQVDIDHAAQGAVTGAGSGGQDHDRPLHITDFFGGRFFILFPVCRSKHAEQEQVVHDLDSARQKQWHTE
jgi:hypothetical protein